MAQIPPEENAEFVDGTDWRVTSKEISFIYRRPSPLKPAWTVMAYGGGGTYGYHYERDRQMLTLRERARIQTFSDDFEFQGTDVRAQIGEAVPPLLGERIACAINSILDQIEGVSQVQVLMN
jgi:DNA (cytosine-5)-methyltransferase 1